MEESIEFRSARSLRAWLESARPTGQWYAIRSPDDRQRLWLNDKPFCDIQWDSMTSERRAMFAIELPAASATNQWWRDLWQADRSSWRFSRVGFLMLVKRVVWDGLPAFHMCRPKEEFAPIGESAVKQCVDRAMLDEMQLICRFCGLAARQVDLNVARALTGVIENE